MNLNHLRAVPTPPNAFIPISDPPAQQQDTIALMRDVERTARMVRAAGAESLEMTVADVDGVQIPAAVVDTGLPEQVRVQAVAVFPRGNTVVGQSDPIDRAHYAMYSNNLECRQALGDLRAKFETPQQCTLSSVPS